MKKLFLIFVFWSFFFNSFLSAHAYRVTKNSWNVLGNGTLFQRSDDARYYRIFNPSTAYDAFIPGRDDAGTLNLSNWNQITWNKWRPWSIRIHTVLWSGTGASTTNCPSSLIGDSNINYWGTTYGWQAVGWSTTVLYSGSWTNRMKYSSSSANFLSSYTSGEIWCDFGANYAY